MNKLKKKIRQVKKIPICFQKKKNDKVQFIKCLPGGENDQRIFQIQKNELISDLKRQLDNNSQQENRNFSNTLNKQSEYIEFFDNKFEKVQIIQDYQEQMDEYYNQKVEKFKTRQQFLNGEVMTSIEQVKNYYDHYPYLKIRKSLKYIYVYIQEICQKITRHQKFEIFVIIIILLNTITQALEDPMQSTQEEWQQDADEFFFYAYLLEAILKILSQGFILGKGAYIKDNWNQLDFLIVTSSIMSKVSANEGLKNLKVLRILRPLRTVSRIKSLKLMLNAIISSFATLKDIIIIMFFYYTLFAITAQQIFKGSLKLRCFQIENGISPNHLDGFEIFQSCQSNDDCMDGMLCAKSIVNPNNNSQNFDTYLYSFIQIFLSCTLEGWTKIQTQLQLNVSYYVFVFTTMLSFVGNFVIINLVLAVVAIKFLRNQKEIKEQVEEIPTSWNLNKIQCANVISKRFYLYKIRQSQKKKQSFTDIMSMILINQKKSFSNISVGVKSNLKSIKNLYGSFKQGLFQSQKIKPVLTKAYEKQNKPNIIQKNFQQRMSIKNKLPEHKIQENNLKRSMLTKKNQVMAVPDQFETLQTQVKNDEEKDLLNDKEFKNTDLNQRYFKQMKGLESQQEIQIKHNQISPQPSIKSNEDEQFLRKDSENGEQEEEIEYSPRTQQIIEDLETKKNIRRLQQIFAKNFGKKKQVAVDYDQQKPSKFRILKNTQFYKEFQSKLQMAEFLDNDFQSKPVNIYMDFNEEDDFEPEVLQKQLDKFIFYGQNIEEAEQYKKDYQAIQNQVSLGHQFLKISPIYNIEYDNSQDHDIMPTQAKKIEQQIYQQRENYYFKYKYNLVYQIPIKIPFIKKKFKSKIEYDEYNMKRKEDNLLLLHHRQQSIFIDKIRNSKGEDFKGLNPPYFHINEVQQNIQNIDDLVQKQQNKLIKEYIENQLKNKSRQKKKKKLQDIVNYETAINNIKSKDYSATYSNLPKNYLFDELKNQQIEYQNQNKYYLDYQFPGVEVFNTHSSDQLFYNIIFKRLKILNQKLNYKQIDFDIWEKNIVGILNGSRRLIIRLVQTSLFDNIIMTSVIGSTVVMMLIGTIPENDTTQDIDFFFNVIFLFEFIFKMIALSPAGYVSDKVNIFDSFIVFLSVGDYVFKQTSDVDLSGLKGLKVLRSLRILRLTKILRALKFFQLIIMILKGCIKGFLNIFILIILFLFIFTLLGVQVFGGSFDERFQYRSNWNSIFNSFLITFQVMTLEGWDVIMYQALNSNTNKVISISYLYLWIFVGNFVLLNLFLAVLLDRFNSDNTIEDEVDNDDLLLNENKINEYKSIVEDTDAFDRFANNQHDEQNQDDITIKLDQQFIYFDNIECEHSLYIFSKQNPFRRFCYWLCKNKKFDNVILSMIVLSSVKLVIDTYIDDKIPIESLSGDEKNIRILLLYLDLTFNGIFIFELFVKVIALGLIVDYESYLRDSWSQLDFVIVFFSIIDMALTGQNLGFMKIIRMLRILKPLRFITNNPSLKVLVNCLMESVPGLLNILLVITMVWLMFAIFFITLMSGNSGYCFKLGLDYYGVNKEQCLNEHQGRWLQHDINFNNIGDSMISLFVLSTLEGWPYYMYQLIDGGPETTGPIKDNYQFISILFIVFIFIGSIFCLNLFIAIVSMNFHIAQEKIKNQNLNKQQEQWILIQPLIYNEIIDPAEYQEPTGYFKLKLFRIIRSFFFDLIIIFLIFANIVTMALDTDDLTVEMAYTLKILNYIFTVIFTIECILKIYALELRNYIQNPWNQFDLFIVIASIIDMTMDFIIPENQETSGAFSFAPQLIKVFRVLRVTRILKLIKNLQGLQRLLQVIIFSLPALMNVTSLLVLIYFIFSVLACFIFKNLTFLDENNQLYILTVDQIIGIEPFIGFQNFMQSFLTLLRCSTGEQWYRIMFDTTRSAKQGCTETSCGNNGFVVIFILFILFQQYIMLNLFIIVIMQNFEDNYINTDNPIQNFTNMTQIFKDEWYKYSSKQYITHLKSQYLTDIYIYLEKPLGMGFDPDQIENEQHVEQLKLEKKRQAALALMKMNLQSTQSGYMYFNEALFGFYKILYTKSKGFLKGLNKTGLKQIDDAEQKTLENIEKAKSKFSLELLNGEQAKGSQDLVVLNPMMDLLYIGMAFKSWQKFQIRNIDHEQTQEQQNQTIFSVPTITTITESDESNQNLSDDEEIDYWYRKMLKDNVVEQDQNLEEKRQTLIRRFKRNSKQRVTTRRFEVILLQDHQFVEKKKKKK